MCSRPAATLRLRTVFNLLGPLTNPARASCQVVGVYSADMVEKLAEALSMLGLRRALVVHGSDGLDEITITGTTRIGEAREGQVRTYEVTPEEFGLGRAPLEEISGGDAIENAKLIIATVLGRKKICAPRCGAPKCRSSSGSRRQSRSSARMLCRWEKRQSTPAPPAKNYGDLVQFSEPCH